MNVFQDEWISCDYNPRNWSVKNGGMSYAEFTTDVPYPVLDGQRAVKVVRHHAKEWNILPYSIGILG